MINLSNITHLGQKPFRDIPKGELCVHNGTLIMAGTDLKFRDTPPPELADSRHGIVMHGEFAGSMRCIKNDYPVQHVSATLEFK